MQDQFAPLTDNQSLHLQDSSVLNGQITGLVPLHCKKIQHKKGKTGGQICLFINSQELNHIKYITGMQTCLCTWKHFFCTRSHSLINNLNLGFKGTNYLQYNERVA